MVNLRIDIVKYCEYIRLNWCLGCSETHKKRHTCRKRNMKIYTTQSTHKMQTHKAQTHQKLTVEVIGVWKKRFVFTLYFCLYAICWWYIIRKLCVIRALKVIRQGQDLHCAVCKNILKHMQNYRMSAREFYGILFVSQTLCSFECIYIIHVYVG